MGALNFLWLVLMHKNVRGIGNSDKKIALTKFTGKHNLFLLCVIETKLGVVYENVINSTWGCDSRCWVAALLVGFFRGIICV
jgi:hypothetical protein